MGFGKPVKIRPEDKSMAYGYLYTKGPFDIKTVQRKKVGEDVTFDTHGPIAGIQHSIGSSKIIFENDGVYQINFLIASGGNGPVYDLFLNDKLIEGNPNEYLGKQDTTKLGQSIIKAKKGDKLTLKLHSVLAANRELSLMGSITIVQIA